MNKIETIVRNYIVRHGMWKHDGFYIVALSGGADSVALLLMKLASTLKGISSYS